MVHDHFWNNVFLAHFRPIFGPKTAHLQCILGFSMGQNALARGAKWAKKHLFVHPKLSSITFGKMRFRPIFDPFLVPKWPICKAFGRFPWAKNVSPRAQNALKPLV